MDHKEIELARYGQLSLVEFDKFYIIKHAVADCGQTIILYPRVSKDISGAVDRKFYIHCKHGISKKALEHLERTVALLRL